MSDETEGTDSEGVDGALSVLDDTIGYLTTGIPAPVRKNAIKAFNRLCTAAIEYSTAWLEGATKEKRAETQARIKLTKVSANQLAEQMQTDPEYVHAAAKKFAQKIIREQVNIDQICESAAANLTAEPIPEQSQTPNTPPIEVDPISDDWLNVFENEAAKMSSEQMQRLFGKILAGEIRKPKSYSIKTIKLMANLDNEAASLFRRLCSLTMSLRLPGSIIFDARVVSFGGRPAQNSLQNYGLAFGQLNILQEYGLIISDYNSFADWQVAIVNSGRIVIPITYQNRLWALTPKESPPKLEVFNVFGVVFTQSGKELLSIVDVDPNEEYTAALKAFFDQNGMIMTNLGS